MRFFLTALTAACFGPMSAQDFVVRPFLQDAEPSSIRITWEASEEGPSVFTWGDTDALGTEVTSSGSSTPGGALHEVHLTGLNPDTPYFYSVTVGTETTAPARFRTPPLHGAEADFTFVAMSDMQKSGNDPEVFDEIIHQGVLDYFGGETSDEIALVLIPGDLVVNGNSYGQWANDFFAPSHDLFSHVPVYPVLGNHEVNTPYYFQYFHLPDNGTAGV